MFTPITEYLRRSNLPVGISRSLIVASYNRAVLLREIPIGVVRDIILSVDPDKVDDHADCVDALIDRISREVGQEIHFQGVFIPDFTDRQLNESHGDWLSRIRPKGWSWLQVAASGIRLPAPHIGRSFESVFNELAWVEGVNKSYGSIVVRTFAERCAVSGLAHLVPTVTADAGVGLGRSSRGRPQERMSKAWSTSRKPISSDAWSFKPHLVRESTLRMELTTFVRSWKSVRSGVSAWHSAFNNRRFDDNSLPMTKERIAEFACFIDNNATLEQYLSHVRKVSQIFGYKVPDSSEFQRVLKGTKKFTIPRTRSFVQGDGVGRLCSGLLTKGRVDLAHLVSIGYVYMLRVPSEGFPIQVDGLSSDPANWHSTVDVSEFDSRKAVTLSLRRRKNTESRSNLKRFCICSDWIGQMVCGVCSLRAAVLRHTGSSASRLFPRIRYTDIRVIKEVAEECGMPTVTWHGFRRGRTWDLLAGRDRSGNPGTTLVEIFEAGGWKYASRGVLPYALGQGLNREAIANSVIEDSESGCE